MPEKITAENLLNNIMESISDNVSNKNLQEDISNAVNSQVNRLFGRQKPIHKLLGAADVLLWRNKKISIGVLAAATAVWVLFEWLNYHFLSIGCFLLAISLVVQFVWSNASGFVNSSPPRFTLPDHLFHDIAASVGTEVNKALALLQDLALGFVAAHTLPVLYEKHEDEVDSFVDNLLGKAQHQYKHFDARFLSQIPSAKFRGYYKSETPNLSLVIPLARYLIIWIVLLMWTGNNVTRPFRVAGAAALAPVIDKGLRKVQKTLNLPSLAYAFALVVSGVAMSCATVVGILVLSRGGK
ncbi:Reticulon-like protein [Drosera capensis]